MARQLILMRHASVGREYAGRYIGRLDLPIAPTEAASIRAAADWLAGKRIGHIICSPLLRARQTADLLAQTLRCPEDTDKDLREVDFGRWEGKTFAEISRDDASHIPNWAQMRDEFRFPEGESIGEFLTRIRQAADRLAADESDVVLAVTHGGVIRSMICHFLGLEPKNYLLFNVRYAACGVIDLFDGKGTLAGLNEPAHICVPASEVA